MKKFLIAFAVLIGLLLAAIIVLPVVFKDDIVSVVKEEANNAVNANIDFGDFGLSMITSFPDFSFSIDDASVIGVDQFDGDTLMYLGNMSLNVDLMSVIAGDEIAIKSISLSDLVMNAIVLDEGMANWDISSDTASSEEDITSDDTSSSNFSMKLNSFSISNASIAYEDRQSNIYTLIEGLDFDLSGDFTQDFTSLKTQTNIAGITVKMEGVNYLKNAKVDFNADMDADLINSKYTFKENKFTINGLELGWNGWVSIPGDDIDLDIKFNASKTSFRNLLSMVPAIYATEFEEIETDGTLALEGYSKGTYTDNGLPAFGLNLKVEDAMFHYPDLPSSVDDININVSISNPGGSEDNTVVEVSKFHLELAKNPVDIHLVLKTPVSDPQIDCGIEGKIELSKLKDVVPMEKGEDMNGTISSDITLQGKLSTIENEEYENFNAKGGLEITDLSYKSADFPQGMLIQSANMEFAPSYVDLKNFDCFFGKSDLHFAGKIENFIAYALTDSALLKGSYTLTSRFLDLNAFMEEEDSLTSEEGDVEDTVPYEVIEVPATIDFNLSSSFDQILYDKMDMKNVKGGLVVKNESISMKDIFMELCGGTMLVNGSYNTIDKEKPAIDFDLDISGFDIKESYNTFNAMEKMAPIMESCNGVFSTHFTMVSDLSQNMDPVYETMTGGGGFQTKEVMIKDSKTIDKMAALLKNDKYKELILKDINATFEFIEGRVHVQPFDVAIGNSKANIHGSNGFDQTLDYTMDMVVPTSEFGGGAAAAMGQMAALINSTGANVSVGDAVNVAVKIQGTTENPIVKLGKISPVGEEGSVKQQLNDEVDKKIEEAKEMAKEELDKSKKEAAAKLITEAQKQAESIIKEAKSLSKKTKDEGYRNAKKLEDEAKNPIQKIAAKAAADQLRKESDKQAQKITETARKKANDIVETARKKANEL